VRKPCVESAKPTFTSIQRRRVLNYMADVTAIMGDVGVASKVLSHCRFGFAAGCEAVARPRRSCDLLHRATPLVRAPPFPY